MNADQQMDLDMAPTTIKELINDTIDSVICAELLGDDEVDLSLSEELETELLGSEGPEEWESCEERKSEKMEHEDKGEDGEGKALENIGQEKMEKEEDGSEDEIVVLEEHGATAQFVTHENKEKGRGETKGRMIEEVIVLDEEIGGATAQIEYMEPGKEESEEKMEESENRAESPEKWEREEEGFANSGFDEIKEALEVLEMPRHKDGKVREYWVAQIQKKGVVLVYPFPKEENEFPYFILLENEVGKFDRPLLPGDRVSVEEYEFNTGKEFLDKEKWLYAGLIQCQAKATKIQKVKLAKQEDQYGLIVDLSRRGRAAEGVVGAVVVAAYGMARAMALYERQLHPEIRMGNLKKAQPLKIQLAKIPEHWLVGPNYVLPDNTPVRTGMELQAGPNTKIPATAGQFDRNWPRKNATGLPIIFPLVPEYTKEEVRIAEHIIAAALVVASEHEDTLKLNTQFKGVVSPQWEEGTSEEQDELPKYVWLKFRTTDRKFVKQLNEQWTTDSPVSAKSDFDSKAFAQGQVVIVKKSSEVDEKDNRQFLVEVKVRLAAHFGKNEQQSEFRQMMNGEAVIVQSAGASAGFSDQAYCFGTNEPSKIAEKEDSPRAEIMKALLARPGRSGLKTPTRKLVEYGLGEKVKRPSVAKLNEEQQQTLALVACPLPLVILQQAPPGTGKTLTLATAIELTMAEQWEESVIVATATSNLPVTKMVEETKAAGVGEELLALFSGTARVRYGEQIKALEGELLRPKLTEEFLEKIKDKKGIKDFVKDFEEYNKRIEVNPLRAREAKVAAAYLSEDKKKVMFLTSHMAARVHGTIGRATHILLDEATQASFTTIVSLACKAPSLRKMLITGDVRQLGVHLTELQEVLWSGFGLESITDQLLKSPRVEETVLKKCYRSHGSLVECVSHASYIPHGEELLPVREVTEARTALTNSSINLPVEGIPLILLHAGGQIQMDETSFSLSNDEHNRIAREMVAVLDANLPTEQSIVIICLYLYEKDRLARAMKRAVEQKRLSRAVEVHTVDSYQAKEADIVVVVTTRTESASAGQSTFPRVTDFFQDSRRATVALSRARAGMVLIADFEMLRGNGVWGRFIQKAQETVPILTEEYVRMMESSKVKRVRGVLANQNGFVPIKQWRKNGQETDGRARAGGPLRGQGEFAGRNFVPSSSRNSQRYDKPRPERRFPCEDGRGGKFQTREK